MHTLPALFHLLPGMTHKRLRELGEYFSEDWERAWHEIAVSHLIEFGWKPEAVAAFFEKKDHVKRSVFSEYLKKKSIHVLRSGDSEFPAIFHEVSPAPNILYVRGNRDLLRSKELFAVVGSRKMTTYGKQCIDEIVPALSDMGMVVISGLAYGVDAYVHKQFLERGGKTIAIIGSGVDVIYPLDHRQLYEDILSHEGLILSDFPIGVKPQPFHFPLRNRLIAALGKGVLVVEAGEKSGAVITAKLALDLGKEVYAFPGSIFSLQSKGTNALLQKGEAALVTSAADVLTGLGYVSTGEATQTSMYLPEASLAPLFELFSFVPQEEEMIFMQSKKDIRVFRQELTLLEMEGAIKKVEGTKWVRGR